ncbi:MAG: DUF2235 domain-containing protein [Pedobacter sp.]
MLQFAEDKRIMQVWFAGVHSDIGGGYPSRESQLSDITLAWMINAARQHGMEFISDFMDYLDPNPTGMLHNSYEGAWKALGENVRGIGNQESIHSSVKARLEGNIGYSPANLPVDPHYV